MTKLHANKALALLAVGALTLGARGDESGIAPDWPTSELHFSRLRFTESSYSVGGGYPGGSWRVDYPEAEYHFQKGVSRLTRVDTGSEGVIMDLSDDRIFDYPWMYAVEVGHWQLSEREAQRLREYLLRGGFLMVDDFHGPDQWVVFTESLKRVFPDRPIVDIQDEAEVLHVLYDVDERIQIPGIRPLMMGQRHEYGGEEPHWRGIYDDDGRLMVMINHNMDLGDAWEHANDPQYPQPMTALAYRFAVNYVIYAMTH